MHIAKKMGPNIFTVILKDLFFEFSTPYGNNQASLEKLDWLRPSVTLLSQSSEEERGFEL